MSTNIDLLEEDLKAIINQMERQLPDHKLQMFLTVFEKHLKLNTGKVLLNEKEFAKIKSAAIDGFKNKAFPKYIGEVRREIDRDEAVFTCTVEATFDYLMSKGYLNVEPKFDYKEKNK